MQTVVLDTNALLMPFEIRINLDLALQELLGEARIVVPGPLVGELKHLDHRSAKAALALARKYEIIPTEQTGDNAVVELAKKENAYVLTNDKELRRRLRKERIPLIYLRSGTHLALETYRSVLPPICRIELYDGAVTCGSRKQVSLKDVSLRFHDVWLDTSPRLFRFELLLDLLIWGRAVIIL